MERTNVDRPLAVSVAKAANLIGVSKWTIRNYAKTGRLQIARVGRRVLVPYSGLEKFVQEATDAVPRII